MHLLLFQPCGASSFFEMVLKDNSIYTPGRMELSLELTDKAKVESDYHFQISVYVADTLVRQQKLAVRREGLTVFEIKFPELFSRTEARCRAELFVNGQFIEASEKPVTLWPALSSFWKGADNKVIWLFDIQGRLQKIFKQMEVEAIDATFQAVRNFGTPDIIFVGQNVCPDNMSIITDYLESVDSKPMLIFLKQKQLPKSTTFEIPDANSHCQQVFCDINSPLLQGLNKLDIMNLVANAAYVKIKKPKCEDRIVNSFVTEVVEDKRYLYSYLATIQEEEQVIVFCQLPVTDGDDPRGMILLNNLLKFAYKINVSQDN
jgi:hypothetical protein